MDKEGAEPNFKGFGLHPLLGFCDNTSEALAGMLRPGSAGSNTTADHLTVLDDAITAVPAKHRRRLMVTCDGAGASHGLIGRLDELARRRGHQLVYSVGWELGERERRALIRVPPQAWQAAIDGRGQVRERRTADACADNGCGHARCWIGEAHVAELTGLLREGPDGDHLAGWPASMRIFARRERPHPGAQLSLFEEAGGWRYSLWVSNLPVTVRGWRAQLAYIDAAHRVHARVEDAIRTGKDCGIGKFPSHDLALNSAWLTASLTGGTLLAWLKLLALDGDLARAEPKTLRYRILHAAGGADPQQPAPPAEDPRHLALGRCHRRRLGPDHRAPASPLYRRHDVPATHGKETQGDRREPPPPARQPGRCHTCTLKSKIITRPQLPWKASNLSG